MKKLYYLIAFLFLAGVANAQYDFDASNTNPSAGNSFTLYKVIGNVSPGGSGADVSWNFTSQPTTTEITATWEATNNTTGNPDLYYANPAVGTPNMKLSYDSSVYFYDVKSTGITSAGRATTYGGIMGIYQRMPYNVMVNVYSYPFQYQDVNNTTVDFNYEYLKGAFPLSGNVTGDIRFEYDGYGNITMPDGKYVSDVARVKITETLVRGASGAIDSVNNTYFEYREAFTPNWIARIERVRIIETNGTKNLREDAYFVKGSEISKVAELLNKSEKFVMYPNPTPDLAKLQFNLAERSDVVISITDILGNELTLKQINNLSVGDYTETINLSDFAKGYYLIKLKINGDVQAQKIQKL